VLETYTYDALGRRVTITPASTGVTTSLFYNTSGNVIEEQQSGTTTTQYVWGLGYVNDLVLRDDNSTSGSLGKSSSGLGRRLYVQQDGDYNVTSVVDTSGSVVQRFIYDPYGVKTTLDGSWGVVTTDSVNMLYGWQGGRADPISGLIHFAMYGPGRDYSPTLGRWTTADPAGYVNGPNLYQMELSNPVAELDPTGWAAPGMGIRNRGGNTPPPPTPDPGNYSMIPLIGPLWDSMYQFENGHWIKGLGDLGFAAGDLTGVEALGRDLLWGGGRALAKVALRDAAKEAGEKAAAEAAAKAAARDVAENAARDEVAEAGGKVPCPTEGHHLLPNQFADKFKAKGLDPKNFKMPLPKDQHRLLPNGIHTGPYEDSWNGVWDQFFKQHPDAEAPQILQQLENMKKAFGLE